MGLWRAAIELEIEKQLAVLLLLNSPDLNLFSIKLFNQIVADFLICALW